MKAFKWIGSIVLLGLILIGGILGYAYTQIDETRIKAEITKGVFEKYQRQLILNGAIHPTIFPLGLSLQDVRLSEPLKNKTLPSTSAINVDDGFLSIGALSLSVDTWALLDKRIVVKAIEVSQARANIIRRADGQFNFSDLLSAPPDETLEKNKTNTVAENPEGKSQQDLHVRVSRVAVNGLTINYRDDQTRENYRVADVRINVKDLAPDQFAPFSVSAQISAQNEKLPKLLANLNLLGKLKLNLPKTSHETLEAQVSDLLVELSADAQVKGLGAINIKSLAVKGEVKHREREILAQLQSLHLQSQLILLDNKGALMPQPLSMTLDSAGATMISIRKGGNAPDINVNLPAHKFSLTGGFSQDGLQLSQTQASGALSAKIEGERMNAMIRDFSMSTQLLSGDVEGDASARMAEMKVGFPLNNPKAILLEWQKLHALSKLSGKFGNVSTKLSHSGLKLDGKSRQLMGEPLMVDIDFQGAPVGGKSLDATATLTTTIKGLVDAAMIPKTLSLSPLSIQGTVNLPQLPKPLPIKMLGSINLFDLKKLESKIEGTLADMAMSLQADVTNFQAKPMQTQVALNINRLDVDAWFPPAPSTNNPKESTEKTVATATDIPINFSPLKAVAGNIKLSVGELKARGMNAQNVKLAIQSDGQVIHLNPLSLAIAGGTFQGSAKIDTEPQRVNLNVGISKINVGELLQALKITDIVRGKTNGQLALSTGGKSLNGFKEQLSGTVFLQMTDGGVKGFNLAKSLRSLEAKFSSLKDQATLVETKAEDELYTDFAEFSAHFTALQGVLTTQDMKMLSPYFRLLGEGSVNLPKETLDLRTRVITTSSSVGQGANANDIKGKGIPVKITGAFAEPKVAIDIDALKDFYLNAEKEKIQSALKAKEAEIKAQAQSKIDEEKKKVQEQLQNKAKDQIKNSLKGLFK